MQKKIFYAEMTGKCFALAGKQITTNSFSMTVGHIYNIDGDEMTWLYSFNKEETRYTFERVNK